MRGVQLFGLQPGLWPGLAPRMALAKAQFWSKIDEKVKVLRMSLPIVENLSGLQESIFNLSRGPQVHFGEKSKKLSNFIKFTDFPPFPLFGVPWAAVIVLLRSLLDPSSARRVKRPTPMGAWTIVIKLHVFS